MNGNGERMDDSCRLCDENGEQMFSVFDKNDEGIQILQLIKECLPIIIYRTDPLPKHICESCHHHINMLYKFKKAVQETADRQREKLHTMDLTDSDLPLNVRLFLSCSDENEHNSGVTDASTATDDLTIFCGNCKQSLVDPSAVDGELELCIAERLKKNKATEKLLRRRKVVPFYHEPDDSLCSSLTEYTQNTEGSQCFSDVESMDSDDTQNQRPNKRSREGSDDENESTSSEPNKVKKIKLKSEQVEGSYGELYKDEEEYRYQPLSLLQLTLNVINKRIVPEHEPENYTYRRFYPECSYCKEHFPNYKLLALHEVDHMEIEIGEKIDNPIPWHPSREGADIRNKWLNYFDENGYDDDDIVIDNDEIVNTENLLIPVESKKDEPPNYVGNEKVYLDGTQPMVNRVYLGDYTKEERKTFYQSMRIQGVNKKFCELCRYIFKDNWAIESHYFSSACYYTCRYCGMRFNKQRHKFNEHVEEHKKKDDQLSEKIYAASKLSNIVPKVIHPPKDRPKKIVVTAHNPPPEMQNGNSSTSSTPSYQSIRVKNLMERRSLQSNLQIKEEPQDAPKDVITSQSKTGNQAYFCRKCYKVFFKLDEFNIHSKNCDYNQFPQMRNFSSKPVFNNRNGDVSPAGRPMRNCAKEAGPYKDEVYLPDSVLKEPKLQQPQTFVCFICNTPFPTIYSRNSHMRIHKGDMAGPAPTPLFRATQQRPSPGFNQQTNYRSPPPPPMHMQQQPFHPPESVMIKQEPMDMPMEPMVEIHEPEQNTSFPETLGDGAVSITPIQKNPKQKPTISSSIMKMVQNNPQLSISKKVHERSPVIPSSHLSQLMPYSDPDKTYKCSSCWEAFANKSHLYFHKKNQCEGSRLPCPFCKKRFGTEAEYSSHIYYSHPE